MHIQCYSSRSIIIKIIYRLIHDFQTTEKRYLHPCMYGVCSPMFHRVSRPFHCEHCCYVSTKFVRIDIGDIRAHGYW